MFDAQINFHCAYNSSISAPRFHKFRVWNFAQRLRESSLLIQVPNSFYQTVPKSSQVINLPSISFFWGRWQILIIDLCPKNKVSIFRVNQQHCWVVICSNHFNNPNPEHYYYYSCKLSLFMVIIIWTLIHLTDLNLIKYDIAQSMNLFAQYVVGLVVIKLSMGTGIRWSHCLVIWPLCHSPQTTPDDLQPWCIIMYVCCLMGWSRKWDVTYSLSFDSCWWSRSTKSEVNYSHKFAKGPTKKIKGALAISWALFSHYIVAQTSCWLMNAINTPATTPTLELLHISLTIPRLNFIVLIYSLGLIYHLWKH